LPAEAARFRRRVRTRDLWFIGVVAGGLAVGTPAAILLSDSGSADLRGSGCVATIEAGFMGGQTHRYCGAAAVAFCRRTLTESRAPDGCEAILARVSD
jgi:hypothetical protein